MIHLKKILELIEKGETIISNHGYDELAEDGILVRDVMAGVEDGKVVEGYLTIIQRGRVFLYYKEIEKEIQYMWCGVFRRILLHHLYWLQHINPII